MAGEPPQVERMRREVGARMAKLRRLPDLIRETIEATEADTERAAQLLFLCPSMHILATRLTAVAKEGALKVREVVLNHTEGIEGSEFKHGPNTILGHNTIYGPQEIHALLEQMGKTLRDVVSDTLARGAGLEGLPNLVQAVAESVLSPSRALLSLDDEERALLERRLDRDGLLAALYADYPLVYVTGPDERDLRLTVSQINTHKIRGAMSVVIAEDHPDLRQAATKAPAGTTSYRSVYVALPRTNDTLLTVFSSTVVLQRLALKMSLSKMQHLDRLGLADHGVHPDVPKNVSKSITVD